jgi:peptide/nickel transport system ATP-binding protein
MERLADRVAIMHRGQIVQTAPTREVCACPTHPYTRTLLEAVPRLDRRATAEMLTEDQRQRQQPRCVATPDRMRQK